MAPAGVIGVSGGTRLKFTDVSQNDPNGEEGCGKARRPLAEHPCPTKKNPGKTEEAEIPPSCYCCWLVFLLHLRVLVRN